VNVVLLATPSEVVVVLVMAVAAAVVVLLNLMSVVSHKADIILDTNM